MDLSRFGQIWRIQKDLDGFVWFLGELAVAEPRPIMTHIGLKVAYDVPLTY